MRKNNILCSTSFWEKFRNDRETLSRALTIDEITNYQCWINYFLMINHSSINFEFDEQYLIDSNDELLSQLWHAVASGIRPKDALKFSTEIENAYNDGDNTDSPLNSLYLSSKDIMSHHGIISLSESDYLSKRMLFKDSGPALKKRNKSSWSELLSIAKHNFNAMIVVDNYIFSDKTEVNLTQIFETLLPIELDVPFHLTIVTSKEKIWSDSDLSKKRETVVSTIQRIRPILAKNIVIEVFAVDKSEIHDRTILTNYMWIGSGGGFDILRKNNTTRQTESTKSTKLTAVYPMFIEDPEWEKAYHHLIEDIKKALRVIGKCSENRLFKED